MTEPVTIDSNEYIFDICLVDKENIKITNNILKKDFFVSITKTEENEIGSVFENSISSFLQISKDELMTMKVLNEVNSFIENNSDDSNIRIFNEFARLFMDEMQIIKNDIIAKEII